MNATTRETNAHYNFILSHKPNNEGDTKMTKAEEVAKRFGCTVAQAKNQAVKSIRSLEAMHDMAISTGKKVHGYTAKDLLFRISNMTHLYLAEIS